MKRLHLRICHTFCFQEKGNLHAKVEVARSLAIRAKGLAFDGACRRPRREQGLGCAWRRCTFNGIFECGHVLDWQTRCNVFISAGMKDNVKTPNRIDSGQQRATWEQAEGCPLPLGAKWIEGEQAFNFAVHAEHAESVTLLLYAAADLVNPLVSYRFDFLHNKSGQIWHCRIPIAQLGGACYYGYSVSGEAVRDIHSFDPQKVLLDPYAKGVFFPPDFDRQLAMREGSNAGHAPLGMLKADRAVFDWTGDRGQHHDSDAVIYELHVKGFTKNPNSGVDPSRAGTYMGLVEKIPYLKGLGITVVELMPIYQRDPQEGDYWGYMPLNFFAPHAQYASTREMNSILNSEIW
jgi:pullulanase/glycogen debranching enzyme